MPAKKLLLILTAVLIASNVIYCTVQIYHPTFLELESFNSQPEIILLVANSMFVILAFFIWFSLRKSPPQTLPVQTEILDQSDRPSLYTDIMLIDHVPKLLCIKDKRGRWIQASQDYLSNLSLQYIDYIGKTDEELALNQNSNVSELQANTTQDKLAWQVGKPVKEIRTTSLDNGDTVSFEIIRTPVFDESNQPFRLFVSGQYLQQSYKERTELELLTSLFASSHLSFIILDSALKINRINAAFSSLTGYSIDDVKNHGISFIKNSKTNAEFDSTILSYFRNNDFQLWSGEVNCQKKDGDVFPAKLDIMPIQNKNNAPDNCFVTLTDITQHKQNEKRILRIAHYDDLTGLANRVMFMDRMVQFLSASKRHNLHAVIFFIDLDQFKGVNDSLGHDAGDEVLKEAAKRLQSSTRKEDLVARFSGDEFAILLLNEKSHEKAIFSASLIAEKIIKTLSEMFYINRHEVFIGSSIGVAIYPEDGSNSEILLKNADIAMYEAKNKGRNNYQFYKKEYAVATKDRLALENNLRKALAKNELKLYYQPQYNARSRDICGAEVLIRWIQDPHGKNKMIPPDYFIPIAEDTGLIIEIGKWILETACRQLKSWLDDGLPLKQVSVNISARQFMDDGFLQSVENALEKAKLHPKHLELEITESMLIGDIDRIELQLKRLKKMGLKIALDDFGTGYSSLSYLKRFPIDILKIDQSFVRDMTVDSKDAKIACAIIDMGHSLGQKVVAEGVENETQLMFLSQRKCDIIQGYYFSRPLPVFKMTALLQAEHVD